MYNQSSILIASVLFVSMLLLIEAGYRLGLAAAPGTSESSRTHINAVQTSLLGILALLLAFTFSLALQRFDSRSAAVVDEANAIGTAYLRTQLLPVSVRNDARQGLRNYLDLRVAAGVISLDNPAEREALLAKSTQSLDALWRHAMQAAEVDARQVTSGLFIQSLNEVIDSFARRDAALNKHVPEVVLFLLYGVFIVTGGIIGYTCGIAGHRPSFVSYTMVTLIVLLVFIIIDLDHPRRGLIKVSQKSLTDLHAAIAAGRNSEVLKQ